MPFRDIVGHRALLTLFSHAIGRGTLPPSLILSGPDGVGKRTTAEAIAQALNCLQPVQGEGPIPFDACGTCSACERIPRGVHPDVLRLQPNDKGNIKIDGVRALIDHAAYRPFEGRTRVVIIDQADALEVAAQNALLKVLEEPPSDSVFLLVTAHPDALLITVRSRCPNARFRSLATTDVADVLMAHDYAESDARALAALADGSAGRAMASSTEEVMASRDAALHLLASLASNPDPRRRLDAAKEVIGVTTGVGATDRERLAETLRVVASLLRDVELLGAQANPSWLANPDMSRGLAALAPLAGERARRGYEAVGDALRALDGYTNAKLIADWLAMRV